MEKSWGLAYAIIFFLDALYTYVENVCISVPWHRDTGGEKCGGAPLAYGAVFQKFSH
jgi:hypothetical protein